MELDRSECCPVAPLPVSSRSSRRPWRRRRTWQAAWPQRAAAAPTRRRHAADGNRNTARRAVYVFVSFPFRILSSYPVTIHRNNDDRSSLSSQPSDVHFWIEPAIISSPHGLAISRDSFNVVNPWSGTSNIALSREGSSFQHFGSPTSIGNIIIMTKFNNYSSMNCWFFFQKLITNK